MEYFGENGRQKDFGRRSLRGGAITVGSRIVSALVQVASVVVLARLLTPEDYGLVGMVSAILGIAPLLIDLGTRNAVIQQSHITQREVSALFWMTLLIGCGFAAAGVLSGPLIAYFYNEPRLAMVATVNSVSLVFYALSYQHQALLARAMQYRVLAIIDVTAGIIGTAVAIGMAWQGMAYWALVLRPVTVSVLTTVGVWTACRWIPGRWQWTTGVKEMLKFGLHWLGYSASDFIGSFADRVA